MMQAMQSGPAVSESGCRIGQFAALRYMSRHLESDGEASWAEEANSGEPEEQRAWWGEGVAHAGEPAASNDPAKRPPFWELWGASRALESPEACALALEARELLQALRLCNELLVNPAIAVGQRKHCFFELVALREQSRVLMERFLYGGPGQVNELSASPEGGDRRRRGTPVRVRFASKRVGEFVSVDPAYGSSGHSAGLDEVAGRREVAGGRPSVTGAMPRLRVLEEGAAGWMAC